MISMIAAADKPTMSNVFAPPSGIAGTIAATIFPPIKTIAIPNKAMKILPITKPPLNVDYRIRQ